MTIITLSKIIVRLNVITADDFHCVIDVQDFFILLFFASLLNCNRVYIFIELNFLFVLAKGRENCDYFLALVNEVCLAK